MHRKYFLSIFSAALVLLWFSFAFTQDSGIRDTARVECAENVRPNSEVVLNVYIFNDEPLGGYGIPLAFPDTLTNLDITCDSVSFVGTRSESSHYRIDTLSIENSKNRLVVWAEWWTGELSPGNGCVAKVYFHTGPAWDSTLEVAVDTTFWPPVVHLEFATVPGWSIFPAFVKGCLKFSPFLHGDANSDRLLNASDVIYLVNYLFKGGPVPNPLTSGDSNCDGKVTVGDVVYLINYYFKGGSPPAC